MATQDFFRRASMAALVFVATAVMGCGEKKEAGEALQSGSAAAMAGGMAGANAAPAPELTPETQHAIDAGNAAFRAKDYALALTEFEKAAVLSPQLAAPWFGIYMVAQVRKDTKAADAALAEIRKRGDAPAVAAPRPDSAAPAAGAKTGTGVTKN